MSTQATVVGSEVTAATPLDAGTEIDPARVSLRPVTAETVRAVCALSVRDDQAGLVASSAVSLAEALFSRFAWHRAIYLGETIVGFVMLHDESLGDPPPPDPQIGVWRFLVDRSVQGRGVGRAAFRQVIDHVRRKGARILTLSYVPIPGNAEPFYRALGFEPTGRVDDGEIELSLRLRDGEAGV